MKRVADLRIRAEKINLYADPKDRKLPAPIRHGLCDVEIEPVDVDFDEVDARNSGRLQNVRKVNDWGILL